MTADVQSIVVGAGAVGLAIGRALAQQPREAVVIGVADQFHVPLALKALAAGRPKAAEGPLMGAMTPSATNPDGHSDGQDSDRAVPATARAMPSTEPAAIRARVIQTTYPLLVRKA
jgi:2-polyprenyl-6-methoxyphenol hydroxylase-like FAD-dependent oxidoreductase